MSAYARSVKRLSKRLAPRLGRLDIELTERCNNDCIHCCINLPAGDEAARFRETTTGRIKALLTEAVSLGCLRVRFTGGEPLLRHDFEELYLFARRLGMKVLLFTNATLITPPLADLLARVPPLAKIEITVYGMSAESYEAVTRRHGSFASFRRGVELLLERNVPFILKSALLPPNRHEIEAFETWCGTIPWMNKPPSYSMFFSLRSRRDDEEKNRLIAEMRLSPEEGLAVLTRNESRYRKTMQEFTEKFMGPPGDFLFRCGAGRGLCIDAYGRAQPCMGGARAGVDGRRGRVYILLPFGGCAGALRLSRRTTDKQPRLLGAMRELFSEGVVRAVSCEVVVRERYAGYASGVPLRHRSCAGALFGVAEGGGEGVESESMEGKDSWGQDREVRCGT